MRLAVPASCRCLVWLLRSINWKYSQLAFDSYAHMVWYVLPFKPSSSLFPILCYLISIWFTLTTGNDVPDAGMKLKIIATETFRPFFRDTPQLDEDPCSDATNVVSFDLKNHDKAGGGVTTTGETSLAQKYCRNCTPCKFRFDDEEVMFWFCIDTHFAYYWRFQSPTGDDRGECNDGRGCRVRDTCW